MIDLAGTLTTVPIRDLLGLDYALAVVAAVDQGDTILPLLAGAGGFAG